jgi:hypothetical protein
MRNDYKIRPRSEFKGGGIAMRGKGQALRGGGIATRGTGQALKKGGMADMITAKMSKKKKGKIMKGKR